MSDTTGQPFFECLFFCVIPASKVRRESFRKDSGQAGMTEIVTVEVIASAVGQN